MRRSSAKIGSVANFNSWVLSKSALRQGIKPLVFFAGAQEAILTHKQEIKDNIRQYGAKMKTLLEEMNNIKHIVDSTEAIQLALRAQNEKQAITKFEQHILNPELQRLASASNKQTLDELISYASEKELWLKSSSLLKCSVCYKNGHLEFECKQEGKRSDFRGNEGNINDRNSMKPPVCYKCGKRKVTTSELGDKVIFDLQHPELTDSAFS